MSILLSLQAVGAQTAEQMPDLTAVTAPTEAEINVIDLAFKGGWIMVVLLLLSLMACYIFIQRLMVIGNFSLISGLSPQAVHEWYLGVYIDAFEWVELPNTLGMSQFGDGGLLASKPYVSSASYIHKMSNYCQGCRYQHNQRTGEQACPFNALYWDFFARNQARLGNNPRLGIVFKQLADMTEEDRQAIADRAGYVRLHLNDL